MSKMCYNSQVYGKLHQRIAGKRDATDAKQTTPCLGRDKIGVFMETLSNIALLIDADNTQLSELEGIIQEVTVRGRITVKRAYGNWQKANLKKWGESLKNLAIKAEQQFDYVTGKNATDMALVIDAMQLLHTGEYDAFAIVSSDSDFTPLSIALRESGVYVFGVGKKQTPAPFINSCDEFIFLEDLGTEDETPAKKTDEEPKKSAKSSKSAKDDSRKGSKEERLERIDAQRGLKKVHRLLKVAYDTYQDPDNDGFASISMAGNYIKRAMPEFRTKTYGFKTLVPMLEAFPDRYEVRKDKKAAGGSVVYYKCR